MSKSITINLTDEDYKIINNAANLESKTLPEFLLHAAIKYANTVKLVNDEEMQEIMSDETLVHNLQKSLENIKNNEYEIIE